MTLPARMGRAQAVREAKRRWPKGGVRRRHRVYLAAGTGFQVGELGRFGFRALGTGPSWAAAFADAGR